MPVTTLASCLYDSVDTAWLPYCNLLLTPWNLSPATGTGLKIIEIERIEIIFKGEFLLSLASFSMPTFLVLLAMAIWLTVLAAFWSLGAKVI